MKRKPSIKFFGDGSLIIVQDYYPSVIIQTQYRLSFWCPAQKRYQWNKHKRKGGIILLEKRDVLAAGSRSLALPLSPSFLLLLHWMALFYGRNVLLIGSNFPCPSECVGFFTDINPEWLTPVRKVTSKDEAQLPPITGYFGQRGFAQYLGPVPTREKNRWLTHAETD